MDVEATVGLAVDVDADVLVRGVFDGQPHAQEGAISIAHEAGRWSLAVGLGARAELEPERVRVAAAKAVQRAGELRARSLCWELPDSAGAEIAQAIVQGTLLRAYRFDRYRRAGEQQTGLQRLVLSSGREHLEAPVREAALICAAQNRARDLANTPSNELTPSALAGYASDLAARFERVEAEVLDETQIGAAGMGAFAAVARGSAESARLIALRYEGPRATARVGLIGKAVTFDAGGLSLKPAAKMHEMKFDMAGGAAVIEAIAAIAQLGLPGRVLGVIGASENLPSGDAVKPGDIVTALDGTTIEVNNTDAEGRLVLADCITYALREGCERLVDLATLTGGVVTALGSVYAGLFCNDEAWADRVQGAAGAAGEPVWRLPLHPRYAKLMSGRYAQLTNHSERREAAPITGAEFLHHFAGATPWAHLDIAGTGYDVPAEYFAGKGATGFGVRLLVELIRSG